MGNKLRMLFIHCLIVIVFYACNNVDVNKEPLQSNSITYDSLLGTWAYCENDDYTELEISDSLYWYIDQGDPDYIGPVIPFPYILRSDSLFVLYGDGSMKVDKQWKIYLKGDSLRIQSSYGTFHCIRIYPRKISEWELKNSDKYKIEFRNRAKAFKCP
jgi:hypothetical protein